MHLNEVSKSQNIKQIDLKTKNYYKTKIVTDKTKPEIIKSLDKLIFRPTNDYIAVFPFCIFDRKYYKHLRDKKQSPFKGIINNDGFTFERQIYYGGTTSRTFRTLYIDGEFDDQYNKCSIKLRFKTLPIYLNILIIGALITLGAAILLQSILWGLIVPIIILREIFIVSKEINRIKKVTTTKPRVD